MFSETPWIGKRGVQEGWGEDHWRQVELLRITLGHLGLRLRADPDLAAIYAHAPDGALVSAALDHRDTFPLLEALRRLVQTAQGLHQAKPAIELD